MRSPLHDAEELATAMIPSEAEEIEPAKSSIHDGITLGS
jgi:hypothetical protein